MENFTSQVPFSENYWRIGATKIGEQMLFWKKKKEIPGMRA